jgi:hypothetical protein
MPPLTIRSGEFIADRFRLTGACPPDSNCLIQACSDLAFPHWETIATLRADSSGYVGFKDATVPEQKRFYPLAQ